MIGNKRMSILQKFCEISASQGNIYFCFKKWRFCQYFVLMAFVTGLAVRKPLLQSHLNITNIDLTIRINQFRMKKIAHTEFKDF